MRGSRLLQKPAVGVLSCDCVRVNISRILLWCCVYSLSTARLCVYAPTWDVQILQTYIGMIHPSLLLERRLQIGLSGRQSVYETINVHPNTASQYLSRQGFFIFLSHCKVASCLGNTNLETFEFYEEKICVVVRCPRGNKLAQPDFHCIRKLQSTG